MPLDALSVLCAQLMRDLLAIAKFLLISVSLMCDCHVFINKRIYFYTFQYIFQHKGLCYENFVLALSVRSLRRICPEKVLFVSLPAAS